MYKYYRRTSVPEDIANSGEEDTTSIDVEHDVGNEDERSSVNKTTNSSNDSRNGTSNSSDRNRSRQNSMNREETTLILSGAGANITYELGAAAYLQKYTKLNRIVGCSAGSIIGLAMAMGWDLDDLASALIRNIGDTKAYDGSLIMACYNLTQCGHMFETDIRHKFLDVVMGDDNQELTFGQLDFDLNIVATNYITGITTLFNKTLTPDVNLVQAVLASTSIPILCPPVVIDDEEYVDGGFNHDYPWQFADPTTSLGIYVIVPPLPKTGAKNTLYEILKKTIFVTKRSLSNFNTIPQPWLHKTIICDVDYDNNSNIFNIVTVDMFNANFEYGKMSTRKFLFEYE